MPASDAGGPRGLVAKVQRYAIQDGPGIRSTVFLKGCPLQCAWCANPELISPQPELLEDRARCQRCGTCLTACPQGAILELDDGVHLDRERCDLCGACVASCPNEVYQIVGHWMTPQELASELLKDRVFYQVSQGGVTFSGGEPLLQAGFMRRVAEELKVEGVHVALDTSGCAPWERLATLLSVLDLVLYDLKLMDDDAHRRATGLGSAQILRNAQRLAEAGMPMIVRLVLVPGYTDSNEELAAKAQFLASLQSLVQVDLLPYHRFGTGKYAQLGRVYPLQGLSPPAQDQLEAVRETLAGYGVQAAVLR